MRSPDLPYPWATDLNSVHMSCYDIACQTRYAIQVVVMAGGANDFALPASDLASFITPYMAFINEVQIRDKHRRKNLAGTFDIFLSSSCTLLPLVTRHSLSVVHVGHAFPSTEMLALAQMQYLVSAMTRCALLWEIVSRDSHTHTQALPCCSLGSGL